MYNAECDKTNPRPVAEIIRLVEKEEKTLTTQKLPVIMLVATQIIFVSFNVQFTIANFRTVCFRKVYFLFLPSTLPVKPN